MKTIPDITNNPPPGSNGTPTPTAVGTPVGDLVTKTIGASGGSLTSSDGSAELIFPAGALAGNTEISIQPITNTAPNGVGNSYRFLPEGIKFLQPVTFKFHYTPDDLASTLADLMGIAFQDSTGGWWRVNNFTNDTVNKIISAPIKHFSIWTAFDMLLISPLNAVVSVNKSISLEVIVIESSDDDLSELGGDNAAAPIVRSSNTKPIIWAANGVNNGNSSFGTITGTSFYAAQFKAPSKIPSGSQNPVNISATVDSKFKYKGETFTSPSLTSRLRIVDAEVYQVEFKILDTVVNYDTDKMIVWDSVSMKVTIKDGAVTISEITNFESRAMPTQLVLTHEAWYFVPDGVGEINIVSAVGTVGPDIVGNVGGDTRLLALTFTESGIHDPKLKYVESDNGYTDFSGGEATPGYLRAWGFELDPEGEPTGDGSPLNGILIKVIEANIKLLKN
jgi:hypothetical protein